jgi:hypothetical protein
MQDGDSTVSPERRILGLLCNDSDYATMLTVVETRGFHLSAKKIAAIAVDRIATPQ